MLIGLYHCVTLVEMVTKHIWNIQFGVVTAPGECSNVGSCDGRWKFRGKKPTWVFGSGLINFFVLHHVSVRFLLRSSVRGNPDDLAIADV